MHLFFLNNQKVIRRKAEYYPKLSLSFASLHHLHLQTNFCCIFFIMKHVTWGQRVSEFNAYAYFVYRLSVITNVKWFQQKEQNSLPCSHFRWFFQKIHQNNSTDACLCGSYNMSCVVVLCSCLFTVLHITSDVLAYGE